MALTVEELQIVLSCDATTAQKVLKSMEATVKAYTDKFQKYFDKMGSKNGPKDLASDVKAIEKTIGPVKRALGDIQRNEYKVGKMLSTEEMASQIAKNCAKATAETKAYFAKSEAEYQKIVNGVADNNRLIGLGAQMRGMLEDATSGIENMPEVLKYQVDQAAQSIKRLSGEYAKSVASSGENSKGSLAIKKKLEAAIVTADKLYQKLLKLQTVSQEGGGAVVPGGQLDGGDLENTSSKLSIILSKASAVGHAIKKAFNHTILGKFLNRLRSVMLRMAAMKLIRGTIEGVKKGLEELTKTSKSSAKAMNTIKAAGGSIKMALGAAVMPIVKALAPVFVRLAGAISSASNALARFFAVVTGQSTYTAVSFSDSLDDVSDSATGAGKAVKGALADFDELVVISKQAGGGGGSYGVESSLSTVADLDAVSALGTRIRNAIESGDWSGIGESINNALGIVFTAFDGWLQKVREMHLGQKLADIIAGFFAPDENGEYTTFKIAGETLADALAVILEFIEDFLRDPPWDDIAGAFGAFWDSFWEKLTDSMDTTTIIDGVDGGTAEEGFRPFWDVIWDKLFPDGWFTGDAPATGNALVSKIDEEVFQPIFNAIDNKINELDQLIGTYMGLLMAKADVWEAKTKLAVLNWIAELTANITNALAAYILKIKIWWQDVVIWLNEKDIEWNTWLVGFYTAIERIKVPLQMVLNDIKQIFLERWIGFLQSLDTPVMRKVLDWLGIDLPSALNDANLAMYDAKVEAGNLELKYEALKNGTYDVTTEHTDLREKIDSAKAAIEDAQTKSAAYKDELANMEKVTAEDAAQTGWLKTAIDNTTTALDSAQGRVNEYSGQLSTLKGGLDETKKATEEVTVDVNGFATALEEIDGTHTASLTTEFDENGEKVLQTVVTEIGEFDKIDATADLDFDVPPDAQARLQGAWDNVSAFGRASGTASLGYGMASGALNTLNGAKTSLSEYGQITANATIGINGAKAVTDALPTIKDAFNAVKDKTGTVTVNKAGNAKPKDLDTMAKSYGKFKDDSTKKGTLNLTGSGNLIGMVGTSLFLTVIATAWSNISAGTKRLTVQLDSGKVDIVGFVKSWNELKDKTVTFAVKTEDEMKKRWNFFARSWNARPDLKKYFTLKQLANGGIAYGPTPALVGEYAGASSNPEVIAPLSSLVKLLTKANAQTGGTSSEEEMRLMREQNAILRQLLAKKVEITPSVQLGQVIDRSQKLYART